MRRNFKVYNLRGVPVRLTGMGRAAYAHARNTPVGRSGTPEEVAALNGVRCSEEASDITGQVIVMDGGNTVQENKATKLT